MDSSLSRNFFHDYSTVCDLSGVCILYTGERMSFNKNVHKLSHEWENIQDSLLYCRLMEMKTGIISLLW